MAECPTCNREFKNVHGMRIHHVQAHSESIADDTVTCEICGQEFHVQRDKVDSRRFCSRSCSDQWRSNEKRGKSHHRYNRKTVSCDNCGDEITRPPSLIENTERNFCSKKCKHDGLGDLYSRRRQGEGNPMYGRTGEDHPNWNGGYEPHNYGEGWQQARRDTLERDEYECQDCGLTREEHYEKYNLDLEVHHITPFRTFDDSATANKLENLITLCKGCHQNRETS